MPVFRPSSRAWTPTTSSPSGKVSVGQVPTTPSTNATSKTAPRVFSSTTKRALSSAQPHHHSTGTIGGVQAQNAKLHVFFSSSRISRTSSPFTQRVDRYVRGHPREGVLRCDHCYCNDTTPPDASRNSTCSTHCINAEFARRGHTTVHPPPLSRPPTESRPRA